MNTDYLKKYSKKIEHDAIQQVRFERQQWLQRKSNHNYEKALHAIPSFQTSHLALEDIISIGNPEELSSEQQKTLQQVLETYIPWRKGPFNVFGVSIDSEWQSHMKWDRVLPVLDSLEGKKVADIGCNNGYYMFRMAAHNPELVIGCDPTARYYYSFHFLQRFAQLPCLHFELLGIEHIHHYPSFFDTVFCMGILYHHTDPISMLRKIYTSMKPKGQLIVESLGIPGEESMALFPKKRYAKVPGTWFVPTESCLINWIRRAGFRQVSSFFGKELTTDEQRSTTWAPYESLKDFLDPNDSSLTVEGYPAPWRFYIQARKP
ncbi:MAG: tRNA 5-methoxyuridine(34)/uridine 5-oxyacetic acid(34) synthase CmoB [SAR324 cluster bacterium]|nr:tRNA 5-methoxyuridine(34)/uridine 5-oxyacetic acid(34) synthase CmoB [SAR324 cluster bacterium]